jgi:hypothetical protein
VVDGARSRHRGAIERPIEDPARRPSRAAVPPSATPIGSPTWSRRIRRTDGAAPATKRPPGRGGPCHGPCRCRGLQGLRDRPLLLLGFAGDVSPVRATRFRPGAVASRVVRIFDLNEPDRADDSRQYARKRRAVCRAGMPPPGDPERRPAVRWRTGADVRPEGVHEVQDHRRRRRPELAGNTRHKGGERSGVAPVAAALHLPAGVTKIAAAPTGRFCGHNCGASRGVFRLWGLSAFYVPRFWLGLAPSTL